MANQTQLIAGQAAILAAIAALAAGGSGDATKAKQDEILAAFKLPHVR